MASDILKLTGVVLPGEQPGVFVGYIKEITGIVVQARSREEIYADLEEATKCILEYKREEAESLLAEQNHTARTAAPRQEKLKFEIALA